MKKLLVSIKAQADLSHTIEEVFPNEITDRPTINRGFVNARTFTIGRPTIYLVRQLEVTDEEYKNSYFEDLSWKALMEGKLIYDARSGLPTSLHSFRSKDEAFGYIIRDGWKKVCEFKESGCTIYLKEEREEQ